MSSALGLFDGPRPDLFLIAEAALSLLEQERRARPVLVAADDVQWFDPQTHQVLTFLGHRASATGLTLIGIVRAGHAGSFVDASFPTLEVFGVDDDTAQEILQQQAPEMSPADRRQLQREARGNPLALLELPGVWDGRSRTTDSIVTLSSRLEHAFAGRISQFPQVTRDLLLVAATDSSSDLNEILAATCGLRHEFPSADAVAPAVDAGLVSTHSDVLEFRHPLVRSGILQTETVVRRQAAHHALAAVLIDDNFRRTWHRAQSIVGPDDPIADELEATVPESLGRGAVLSAVSSLERAASLTSSSAGRGRRLVRAAEYAFETGRPDVVARLVTEAGHCDLSEIDRVRVDRLKESLNDDVRADPGRVLELCTSAGRAADAGDVDLALNILIVVALRCWWAEVGTEARGRVITTLETLAVAHDDARYLCALAITEPVSRGAEIMQQLTTLDFEEVTDADVLRTYGIAAYGIGHSALATDLLDRAGQLFREKGRLGLLPVVLALQFHIRLDLGDWTGSAAASEEVDRVAVETGQALFAFNNVLVESRALALRGEWESALELVVGAEDEAVRLRLNDALCLSYQSRGAALLSGEQPGEAFDCLKKQYDRADPGFHLRESFAGVALTAEAAADSGRLEEGRAILADLESVARTTPSPMLEMNLLYARAVLAYPDDAEPLYQAALDQDLDRWPWIAARIRLEYGRWLCRQGRTEEAAAHLYGAREVFLRMGAARWERRANKALGLCGNSGCP